MKKILFSLTAIVLSITSFTQSIITLNQQEKDAILYMREEEKLARDVYEFLYAKWNVNPFGNIRHSEQTHMDRMKALIISYKLTDPVELNNDKRGFFKNSVHQSYYTELTTTGSSSLTKALKVGAKIEELDIADLEDRIMLTTQPDIINTYKYLKAASENHLNAFVRCLKVQGVTYEPVILSKDVFDKIIASGSSRSGQNRGRPN